MPLAGIRYLPLSPALLSCGTEALSTEVVHLQLTPLRVVCRGFFAEKPNRLMLKFPSLVTQGGLVRVALAEETGSRLYNSSEASSTTLGLKRRILGQILHVSSLLVSPFACLYYLTIVLSFCVNFCSGFDAAS